MKKYIMIGVLVVSALGTLFHFLYRWVPILIFPSSESIFEHLKLVVFPFLVFYFLSVPFYKEDRFALFSSFVTAIFLSMAFIVISYYTYSGILGYSIEAVDSIIYYVSIVLGFIGIYKKKTLMSNSNSVVFLLICILLIFVFSFYPPQISFFRSQTFGYCEALLAYHLNHQSQIHRYPYRSYR